MTEQDNRNKPVTTPPLNELDATVKNRGADSENQDRNLRLKSRLLNALHRIGDFILSPFISNLKLFLTLLVIAFAPIACYATVGVIANGIALKGVLPILSVWFTSYFFEEYLLTLVFQLIRLLSKTAAKVYQAIIIALISVMSIINLGCLLTLNSVFSNEHIFLMRDTHSYESTGFFSQYFTGAVWMQCIVCVIVVGIILYFVWRFKSQSKRRSKRIALILSAILVLSSAALIIRHISLRTNGYFGNQSILVQYGQWDDVVTAIFIEEVEMENPEPQLDLSEARLPENIIILLGESASRDHMSLYGYGLPTTPYFDSLQDDSLIVVMTDAESPASNTNSSFSHFMTTDCSTALAPDNREYYRYETLPSIAKAMGFTTAWISNHVKNSRYGNVVSEFADMCDYECFIPSSGRVYDTELLTPVREYAHSNDSARFVFIHLMGSHPLFDAHYPESFSRFDPSDYDGFATERQSELIPAYDNSIAYTDSVISEIIPMFDDREALIIYLSDHGLDLFKSSKNLCGHGQLSNAVSYGAAIRIPLVFYATPKFRENFPDEIERLKKSRENHINTTNLIPTLLDLFNVRFRDKPAYVAENSALSGQGDS